MTMPFKGISRREAARRFGIDPRTVAKMLKPRLIGFPTGRLTAYAYQEVVSLVLANALRVRSLGCSR